MKCKRAQKMLTDYVNKILGSEDSRLVQEHVVECDSCRRELDVLEKILGLIDDVKVEYPPASIWENFLPDLHRRIEKEAAFAFRKQRQQRFYLLPGWIANTAVVLFLFALVMLKYYPFTEPVQPQQRPENVEMVESIPASVIEEDSSEHALVAGIISEVLITEAEVAKLKELKNFTQSEPLTLSYYYDDDYGLADLNGETNGTGDDEEIIQFLLESEFAEFEESSMIESDGSEFGSM